MCGLFGVLRPDNAAAGPAEAVLRLGELAEERGVDAAGLAWADPEGGDRGTGDRWRIRRGTGPFVLLEDRLDLGSLDRAGLVLGHTRWATQGGRSVRHAGPNSIGQVIGIHNGDIDVGTLPGAGHRVGERTDSELLFAGVDAHTSTAAGQLDFDELVDMFSVMHGRTAAVWVRRADHDRVQLLRAGLSPLAVGYDNCGGLWWASNPGWLRQLEKEHLLTLRRVRMLGEGELWQARVLRDSRRGHTTRMRRLGGFVPVVRPGDVRLARTAVWRGFSTHDAARDKARLRHTVTVPDRRCGLPSRESTNLPAGWASDASADRLDHPGQGWWPVREDRPGSITHIDWPATG